MAEKIAANASVYPAHLAEEMGMLESLVKDMVDGWRYQVSRRLRL